MRPWGSFYNQHEQSGRYAELLWLYPTLSDALTRRFSELLSRKIEGADRSKLDDNAHIAPLEDIALVKAKLREELHLFESEIHHPPIVLLIDDCFTNQCLVSLLQSLLGLDSTQGAIFRRYVRVVHMDYSKKPKKYKPDISPFKNHSLYILGWSLSNVDEIPCEYYSSPLAEEIASIGDDFPDSCAKNNRMIGICFGQQFIANILWKNMSQSTNIIATVPGPPQFWPSRCQIQDTMFVPPTFRNVLAWLSNNGRNDAFSALFTRSRYVEFDLLGSGWDSEIIPLIHDSVSGGVVGWGTKNGSILGLQFHPELNLVNQDEYIRSLYFVVSDTYKHDPEKRQVCMERFYVQDIVRRDIGEAFYAYALYEYIVSLRRTRNQNIEALSNIDSASSHEPLSHAHEKYIDRTEAVRHLVKTIAARIGHVIDPAIHSESEIYRKQWIDTVDKQGQLLLNYSLDWKVNRGLAEASQMLGVSLEGIITEHMRAWSRPYMGRDLGAWDGSTMREIESYFQNKNNDISAPHGGSFSPGDISSDQGPILYGIGDYIYLDLFRAIRNTHFSKKLPPDLLVLFVEKVASHFASLPRWRTIDRIRTAVWLCRFSPDDRIINSSMTAESTSMFASHIGNSLDPHTRGNFDLYLPILEELKSFVCEHIYRLFTSSYDRIYLSKFIDLNIDDPIAGKIDFQYALRSTSHVGGKEYKQILSKFYCNQAKQGAIFVDNGVHQSYTAIPRLPELVSLCWSIGIDYFPLLYDYNRNYVSSVVVAKEHASLGQLLERHRLPTHTVISLDEAYRSTFFQFEYFLRSFIVASFKNQHIFYRYREDINKTLHLIIDCIKSWSTARVLSALLDLINHIAATHPVGDVGTRYNSIEMNELKRYTINGLSLESILSVPLFIPSWMNLDGVRDY